MSLGWKTMARISRIANRSKDFIPSQSGSVPHAKLDVVRTRQLWTEYGQFIVSEDGTLVSGFLDWLASQSIE